MGLQCLSAVCPQRSEHPITNSRPSARSPMPFGCVSSTGVYYYESLNYSTRSVSSAFRLCVLNGVPTGALGIRKAHHVSSAFRLCVLNGVFVSSIQSNPIQSKSPVPFGCVSSTGTMKSRQAVIESARSPMPFGCVSSTGTTKTIVPLTSSKSLQCLSAVCPQRGRTFGTLDRLAVKGSPMPFGCVSSRDRNEVADGR